MRRAEAAVARAEAETGLSLRARGIAEQDVATAELLSREGRGEAGGWRRGAYALADADEDATKTA